MFDLLYKLYESVVIRPYKMGVSLKFGPTVPNLWITNAKPSTNACLWGISPLGK